METRAEVLTALLQAVADGRMTADQALDALREPGATKAQADGATLFEVAPSASPRKPTEKLPRPRTAMPEQAPVPAQTMDGRYDVVREFARGGMGRVLLALDTTVGREIAIKEILPSRGGSGRHAATDTTVANVERFLREARVTGQLEHPNIVPVYEIGTRQDGSVYYTMKFVRGETLAERLRKTGDMRGRLGLLDAFVQVCNAVAFAHSRGVIHRDLKPSNIMLGEFGEVLVLDWGLAKLKGAEEIKGGQTISDGSTVKTLDGLIMGTPAYMAPEQARAEEVDELSDVYALGAMLHEIISGKPAYAGSSPQQIVAKVLAEPPEQLPEDTPPELQALVAKAMHRQRDLRVQQARALADEVKAYRDGRALSVYQYSAGEILKRFVARHKAAVSVAVLLVLALAALAAWSSYAIISEQQRTANERDRALAAGAQADRNALRADAFAQESRRNADEANRQAEIAASRRKEAEENLRKAQASLGMAYAQAARTALQEKRFNEAALLAARALAHSEVPVARAVLAQAPILPCDAAHETDKEGATCMALSIDGRWLAIGEHTGVRIVDRAGAVAPRVIANANPVWAVDYGTDGLLAAIDHAGTLRVFDAAGEALATADLEGRGWSVHFAPDRSRVAVGTRDGAAWVVSLADGEGSRLEGEEGVMDARFSPDGRLLALTSGSELRLLDSGTFEPVRTIHAETRLYRVRFCPLGRAIYAGGAGGTLYAWSVDDGIPLWQARTGTEVVNSLAVAPDGYVAAVGERTRAVLFDTDGEVAARLNAGVGWITGLEFGAAHLVVCGEGAREYARRQAGGTRQIAVPHLVMDIDFAPDNSAFAASFSDGSVGVLDWPGGGVSRVLRGPKSWAGGLAWAFGNRLLASADGDVFQWEGGARKTASLGADSGSIAASPDGSRIAVVRGGGVQIRDTDLAQVADIKTDSKAYALAFSPDGRWLCVGCDDGCVELIQVPGFSRAHRFRAHPKDLLTVTWLGNRIATTNREAEVALFGIDGAVLARGTAGGGGQLFAAAAPVDGAWLAVGDGEGYVSILEPVGLTTRCRFRAAPEFITALRLCKDQRYLLVASVSETLAVVDMSIVAADAAGLERWLQTSVAAEVHEMSLRVLDVPAARRPDFERAESAHRLSLQPYTTNARVDCQLWWREAGLPALQGRVARDYADRCFRRGLALLAEASPDEAEPLLAHAAAIMNDAPALTAYGRCLGLRGQVVQALEVLARAIGAEAPVTFHPGEPWSELAHWHYEARQYSAAWDAVQKAIAHDWDPDEEEVEQWAAIEKSYRENTG